MKARIILLMLGYSNKYSGANLGTQSAMDFHPRNKALSFGSPLGSQPHFNSQKLPQLGRSMSLSKSAKLKLTTIEAGLSTMSQQLHNLKMDTRQSRRHCNYLKDELGQSQLGSTRLKLQLQINKLEKAFKMSKKNDEERGQRVKVDCDRLREGTKKLRNMVAWLQKKTDHCEIMMGTYTGKESHIQ